MCNIDYRPVLAIYKHPAHGGRVEVVPSYQQGAAYQGRNGWTPVSTAVLTDSSAAIRTLVAKLGTESFAGSGTADVGDNPSVHFKFDLSRVEEIKAALVGHARPQ